MTETLWTWGSLRVTGYSLGIGLALCFGLLALWQGLRRSELKYGVFIRTAVLTLPLALLCARLLYVLCDLAATVAGSSYYLDTLGSPSYALRLWDGGFSMLGAVLGCTLAALLAERWTKTERGVILDAMGMALPLGIAVERIFEHGTDLAIGREVTVPFLRFLGRAEGGDVARYPVWLMEAAVALLLCVGLIIRHSRMSGRGERPGDTFLTFLTLFGLTQVLMESLHSPEGHMIYHFLRVQQVLSAALAVAALIAWSRRSGKKALLSWLVTVAAIAAAVVCEFGIDRWGRPLLAYGIMILCLVLIGWAVLRLRGGRASDGA